MSTSQVQTRRRSARLADDEDGGEPPAKKTKLDENAPSAAKHGPARKKASAPKSARTAYSEDVDGFNFSRAKSKKPPPPKTASNQTSSAQPLPTPLGDEVEAPPSKQDAVPNARRKKNSLELRNEEPTKKRRSARLSGESQQNDKPTQELQAAPGIPDTQSQEKSKVPQEGELKVEKKRRTTKIALPFADTPVINRNREMRQSSGQNLRRSSGSLRGRRASSLIESGTSTAIPHDEVNTADFYKHISSDLLETRRMKQLLTWCATRALPERTARNAEDMNATLAARHIEEELLKDFSNKSEMSDWFDRVETAPTILIKKPNPRNQQNIAKLQELRKERERLQKEKSSWNTLLTTFSHTLQHNRLANDTDNSRALDPKALVDAEQGQILDDLTSHPNTAESVQTRIKNAMDSLEFKIDTLGEGTHKLEQLKEALDTVNDQVQRNAANALETRESDALTRTGMDNVGVRDVLRALSRMKQ